MGLIVSDFSDVKDIFFEEEKRSYLDEVRNYKDEIIVAIKEFKTFKELEDKNNYINVIDIVAGYIQDKLTKKEYNDNLKWNMYLIFSIKEELVESEHNRIIEKIEHDKYCCKKYVLSSKDGESLNQEIGKHLPIFINFNKKILRDESDEIGKEDLSPRKKEIPKAISDYLVENNLSLGELLKLNFNMKLIKEIYKGEGK